MRSISETRKMLKYLRNIPGRGGGPSGESSASMDDIAELRWLCLDGPVDVDLAGLEDLGDHAFQWRVLHAQIDDGKPIENGGQHPGHLGTFQLQFGRGTGDGAFAKLAQFARNLL